VCLDGQFAEGEAQSRAPHPLFLAGVGLFLPYQTAQIAGAIVLAAVTAWLWTQRRDLRPAPTA